MADLPELVIGQILGYLEVLDIQHCREISKRWNATAIQVLEDRIDEIQIRITPLDPIMTCLVSQMYMETQRKNAVLDWSSYYFSNFDMWCGIGNQLWSKFGENMRALKLDYLGRKKRQLITTRQLADILVNKAPFLEELELDGLPEAVTQRPLFLSSGDSTFPELELRKIGFWVSFLEKDYSVEFLESLFKSAPNLEKISIDYQCPELQLEAEGGASALESILSSYLTNGRLENLKDLVLETLTDTSMLLLASKVGLTQLTNFRVDFVPEDYDATILHKILESKKDTLESLYFGFFVFRSPKFPTMPNLRRLTIRVSSGRNGNSDSEDDPPECAFDWAEQFPQLVTLVVHDTGTRDADVFDIWDFFREHPKPCLTLKNLEIPPELYPEIFENLGTIFPNVLKLVVALQTKEKNFSYLFSNWPNLKTLVLSTHYFHCEWSWFGGSDSKESDAEEEEEDSNDEKEDGDQDGAGTGPTPAPNRSASKKVGKAAKKKVRRSFDSLLTGFPDAALQLIQQAYDTGAPMSEEEIEAKRTFPSLLNIPNLNHLIFHDQWMFSKYARCRTKLTDLTVKLALEKMKNLKSLLIPKGASGKEENRITPPCFQKLCTDLDLKENPGLEHCLHFVKYDWQMKYKDDNDIFHKSIPDYQ